MGLLESCPTVIRPAPVPSSRCDMTIKRSAKEGNRPCANGCLRFSHATIRASVTFFLSEVNDYMIAYEMLMFRAPRLFVC